MFHSKILLPITPFTANPTVAKQPIIKAIALCGIFAYAYKIVCINLPNTKAPLRQRCTNGLGLQRRLPQFRMRPRGIVSKSFCTILVHLW